MTGANRPSKSMHVSPLTGSFGGLFQHLYKRNYLNSGSYTENIGPSSATRKPTFSAFFSETNPELLPAAPAPLNGRNGVGSGR